MHVTAPLRIPLVWLQTWVLWCFAPLLTCAAEKPSATARAPVDFATQVQPILAKRCFFCHGPDKSEGGLRLNKRDSVMSELPSGSQAVIAGDVEKSELILRVTSTEESERMPPEGKPLTADQIEILRRWIAEGAKWEEHWSFRKPERHVPPAVKDAAWITNPIDAFVLAKLEQHGLSPAARAEKITLIRRAYYDLTGLPPAPAEVDGFLKDDSPKAYEKLIDRLLESPRYGERWGRHWLDVVRYADTNSFERDGNKPHSWRYRDYVIRAFNADKPYDQFVREQLAGDEMPNATNDSLIATGFYRLGLWDDEPADRLLAKFDVLDDIVATTGQVFLGLTVNCARCHDHKIDPIPQKDYYRLLSFFHGITPNGTGGANVERQIFPDQESRQKYMALAQALDARRNQKQAEIQAIESEFRTKYEQSQNAGKVSVTDLDELEYRFYRDHWERLPDFDNIKPETIAKLPAGKFDLSPATRESDFGFVFTGFLKVPVDGEYTFSIDSDDGVRLTIDGKQVLEYDGIHGIGSPRHAKVLLKQGRLPIRLDYFQGGGGLGLNVDWSGPGFQNRSLSGSSSKRDPRVNIAELIKRQGNSLLGAEKTREYERLQGQLQQLKNERVPAEYAMCVTEFGRDAPETFVLSRGNPHVTRDKVEPAFPELLGGGKATIPTPPQNAQTSGRRLVLANWIASPENQMTARVMMNRIWQHHFGRGIARSPNNFGQLGDLPTHPELLDWLSFQFIDKGWSMKAMHKLIMHSSTYQMSSRPDQVALEKDPANNLFSRFDMRRLSAEELRDSIHAINGSLNLKMFGPGYYPDISAEVLAGQSAPGSGWGKSSPEEQARRSIYIHVKRSLITPLLSDFDFADTDSSCAARFATTQPTQALGMLNGSFLHTQAAAFADRLKREAPDNIEQQIRLALRLALNREPDKASVERGMTFIKNFQQKHQVDANQALKYYCLLVYNLNEFVYVD